MTEFTVQQVKNGWLLRTAPEKDGSTVASRTEVFISEHKLIAAIKLLITHDYLNQDIDFQEKSK